MFKEEFKNMIMTGFCYSFTFIHVSKYSINDDNVMGSVLAKVEILVVGDLHLTGFLGVLLFCIRFVILLSRTFAAALIKPACGTTFRVSWGWRLRYIVLLEHYLLTVCRRRI